MTSSLLITNAKIITPTAIIDRGWLVCEGKLIRAIGWNDAPYYETVEQIDAEGLTLLPGFIDVHVHGGDGHEIMDANPDGLRAMARFYAQHGVTSFLATTWTDSRARIRAGLEVTAKLQGSQPDGATILGAHLEGPYINAEKCGAQRPEDVRRAGREEATAFLDLEVIRLVSLAPEFEENHWLIRECVKRGITVSVAHTAATYQQITAAVELGLSHATHTYNAMTGLSHREPGTLGAVMTLDNVYCELIADNIHVHPAAMKLLYTVKGANRLILITDAVRGAGQADGEYKIDNRTVVVKDGAVRLPDGTLAGSTLTMERGLNNLMAATGLPIESLWKTTSLNAARSIHVSDRKGSLEAGKDADLVLLDEDIQVRLTVADGRIVYRAM
jgi:N-acetylglucosamine-6-phosphate deacetylase